MNFLVKKRTEYVFFFLTPSYGLTHFYYLCNLINDIRQTTVHLYINVL